MSHSQEKHIDRLPPVLRPCDASNAFSAELQNWCQIGPTGQVCELNFPSLASDSACSMFGTLELVGASDGRRNSIGKSKQSDRAVRGAAEAISNSDIDSMIEGLRSGNVDYEDVDFGGSSLYKFDAIAAHKEFPELHRANIQPQLIASLITWEVSNYDSEDYAQDEVLQSTGSAIGTSGPAQISPEVFKQLKQEFPQQLGQLEETDLLSASESAKVVAAYLCSCVRRFERGDFGGKATVEYFWKRFQETGDIENRDIALISMYNPGQGYFRPSMGVLSRPGHVDDGMTVYDQSQRVLEVRQSQNLDYERLRR
jgi:hypothetical protein